MSVKRIPGQDARFGTLYVNASDYDRLAISHQSALDDCKARCTERDALAADNKRLLELLADHPRGINGFAQWQVDVDYALSSGKEAT
jgi:hypothetical protein